MSPYGVDKQCLAHLTLSPQQRWESFVTRELCTTWECMGQVGSPCICCCLPAWAGQHTAMAGVKQLHAKLASTGISNTSASFDQYQQKSRLAEMYALLTVPSLVVGDSLISSGKAALGPASWKLKALWNTRTMCGSFWRMSEVSAGVLSARRYLHVLKANHDFVIVHLAGNSSFLVSNFF